MESASLEPVSDPANECSLTGSTLRVYFLFLSNGPNSLGLRRVQRELGFSSPSSASYQLEKLVRLGLIEKDDMGDYVLRKIMKVDFLRSFVFLRGHAFPKNAVYGFAALLVNFACISLLLLSRSAPPAYLALLPGILSTAIFWYEALKAWQIKQKMMSEYKETQLKAKS